MAPEVSLRYDVEKAEDQNDNKMTTIKCHGAAD
jgi:hypothetical protein